jgi:hypothetical protein
VERDHRSCGALFHKNFDGGENGRRRKEIDQGGCCPWHQPGRTREVIRSSDKLETSQVLHRDFDDCHLVHTGRAEVCKDIFNHPEKF